MAVLAERLKLAPVVLARMTALLLEIAAPLARLRIPALMVVGPV